jgi:hypothetical protein
MRPLAVLAALVAMAGPAAAQTAEAALQEFGLMGTWAPDCGKPAARSNIYVTYAVNGSDIVNTHDPGQGFQKESYSVRGARKMGADALMTQMRTASGAEMFVVMRKAGDKVFVSDVTAPDGSKPVKSGMIVANASLSPMLVRCR